MNKKFSVIILCYRHFEYLHSAIESVLQQNYDNIELIVSDDHSDGFPFDDIGSFIQERKKENVTNVVIRQEKENSGTVRHINHAVKDASGDYIVLLAGDDALYDKDVLSNYVTHFQSAPKDCLVEMAQTAMYDEQLTTVLDYYLKDAVRRAIEETASDGSKLRRMLIKYGACLPSTSTCFKRRFFDEVGYFDERYVLVEDYPMHYKLAETNRIIHYADFLAIKHRSGGISHGQSNTLSKSRILYLTDTENMIKEIVMPNLNCLDEHDRDVVRTRQMRQLLSIQYQKARSENNYLKLLWLAIKNPAIAYKKIRSRLYAFADVKGKYFLFGALGLFFCARTLVEIIEASVFTGYDSQKLYGGILSCAWLFVGIWGLTILIRCFDRIFVSIETEPEREK